MALKRFAVGLLVGVWTILSTTAQEQGYEDYQDYADGYQQDNLYADYAIRQQEKGAGGGGGGMGKLLVVGGLGWVAGGKVHSTRAKKAMQEKFMKEQKTLYSQYYNDVYKLQEQNSELALLVEQLTRDLQTVQEAHEKESLERDYQEFKQPDVDGDDMISRAEFNMYIKTYLSNYPGLAEKDYPRFEDFDYDQNGYINFQEYSQQMTVQAKKAEQDKKRAQQSGSASQQQKANLKAHAYKGLSGEAKVGNDFDDLYAKYRK